MSVPAPVPAPADDDVVVRRGIQESSLSSSPAVGEAEDGGADSLGMLWYYRYVI